MDAICRYYSSIRDEVYDMYVTKCYSKSEISRELDISRHIVKKLIDAWGFTQEKRTHGVSAEVRDFIDANKETIISMLNEDESLSEIARSLNVDRGAITRTCVARDPDIKKAYEEYHERRNNRSIARKEKMKDKSFLDYEYEDIEGEVWADIEDYPGYQVSNMGRVRHYAKRYKAYHLIKPSPNVKTGRYYVSISNKFGRKNWSLPRLVAIYHVPGFSEFTNNTVNHEDGDVTNNKAINLTWMTQEENNLHKYFVLQRGGALRVDPPKGFKYKGKFYKTMTQLASDIHQPVADVLCLLADPEKNGIEIID